MALLQLLEADRFQRSKNDRCFNLGTHPASRSGSCHRLWKGLDDFQKFGISLRESATMPVSCHCLGVENFVKAPPIALRLQFLLPCREGNALPVHGQEDLSTRFGTPEG